MAEAGTHSEGSEARPFSGGALLALLALFAIAWFATLDARHLIKPDEGRYAEIAREMVATGDWLTPRLNGYKYFEKPALQYWATAAGYVLLGINEWTARLWPAVTGFLGVLAAFWFGNRLFGAPAGLYAAVVLGSSAMFVFTGHFLSLDMGLALFMSLAVLAWPVARHAADARAARRWMLAGWAAMALAVLSKGLVGIVLPVAAVGLSILASRDWAALRRLELLRGGALFLAITAPWFTAVSLANPEFFDFFFIHEHFQRFLTKVHDRYEPPWYFLPVLGIGLMPWTLALLPAGAWVLRRQVPGASRAMSPERFLLLWCAVVMGFFSASSSKLPAYILPLWPAAAVVVGAWLARASDGANGLLAARRWLAGCGVLSFAGGAALVAVAMTVQRRAEPEVPAEALAAYAPWLLAAGVVLALGGVAGALLCRSHSVRLPVLALGIAGLACTQLALTGHGSMSVLHSAYHTAERARPLLAPDTPFYVVGTFDHTLPFYLGRTVTMVSYKDELAMPIGWEPRDFIANVNDFWKVWAAQPRALALISQTDFRRLGPTPPGEFEVVSSDVRRVLLKKPGMQPLSGAAK